MKKLYSDEYKNVLQTMHSKGNWGADGHLHWEAAVDLCNDVRALTLLDYGCGKGEFKKAFVMRKQGLRIFEYDPGIIGKDKLPPPADVVVCTDVLEHVEMGMIGFVLKHIYELTNKGCYLVISCRPARTLLPDGRNAHLIIRDPDWWLIKLEEYFPKCRIKAHTNGKTLWATITK